ncbi:hypothetical protein ACFWR9_11355 [Streptomyces sp. NPDC058534]|uniref:hypothetical protein n=1 Tax=Streptomyces sp. NPDC058534 TaxID=3346541 RepID=UPI00365577EA
MPEKHVSVTLTFATENAPAVVGSRVAEVVVAEVPANLTSVAWTGFVVDDEPDARCAHTSWEETPFRLGDGTPVVSRKCADCREQLPTILLEGGRADA